MMHKVSMFAKIVLDCLVKKATENGGSIVIDNDDYRMGEGTGCYMSVSVEILPDKRVSVAHYYLQNGDMMRDPEIVYYMDESEYYPAEFIQDSFGKDDVYIFFDDNGKPEKFYPSAQYHAATFSGMWMKNINEQQKLNLKMPGRIDMMRISPSLF